MPSATSFSDAVGSEGAWIATSSPAFAKRPFVARVVEADVIRVRRPVERQRDVLRPGGRGGNEQGCRRERDGE